MGEYEVYFEFFFSGNNPIFIHLMELEGSLFVVV